jgi:hypothetical protein
MANQKMAVMANPRKKMCAHIPCFCVVPEGEQYCGESCRDAGSEDVEIACQCDHAACPLTIRPFAAHSTDLHDM